ncbi:tubulin folding cofactor D, TBCD [Chondrus crispus]|uniref:Tubulin folding cofactor D, TBCD n=1 Tax=Chondrus crispus TaxID=2769 RepID=R7QFP3_CHOCR|nr:tubulin folding cofactor D, TBCD [Chondrus crispus]CDF36568.1 tubulin folding cofactor D, TBCD [Chondrus crispus]|eukprot:XP_005716387.1 tubulin folding cofactor D, TBCD [Chondrus crispus]
MSDPAVTHCDAVLPHAATLEAQLALLQSDDLRTARPACRAFCAAADEYLQLPTLLDPLLPSLLPPLFTLLSARLTSLPAAPAAPTARELLLARLPADALYTLSKVRRLKPFSRHFPHRVSHLHALSRHVARAAAAFPPDHYWTVHYVLLAWAAVAIQLPFPLRTILQPAALAGLLDPARDALHRSGPVAAVAAAFLARLAARRDAAAERADLLAAAVRTALEPADSPAMRIPALTLLAAIFKFAHRDDLRLHVAPVRDALAPLLRPHKTNTTEAHLFTKLGGRLALAVLPPRLAPWRYDRGRRGVVAGHVGVVEDGEAEEDDEIEEEAAETLETVVEILLSGLAHPDTVVRWSAAKGVGRVTSRLPLVYAQDVVNSVLDLYSHVGEARADASWHGGCLALAELARRGLLLPREPQFAQTFDVIGKAAAFDMRRGANSTGAHVRDAACYGVWAMARAYSREDLAPYAKQITNCMLPLALLDREVNCRRAAAAALQECVGRLSERLFEDGISLITLADYFSLGDRVAAYLRIAPQVASLAGGEHFDCILYHLTHKKLVHWDPAVRALASQGLAALLAVDNGNVIVQRVVPKLLQMAKERGDMVIRHGAVLGLAEVVRVVGAENLDQAGAEVRNVLVSFLVPDKKALAAFFEVINDCFFVCFPYCSTCLRGPKRSMAEQGIGCGLPVAI